MANAESLPPIKLDPRFGYFPRWPEDGDEWLHPEDVAIARQSIPSPRIWRKDESLGAFDTIRYGDLVLRVRPALWQLTPAPTFGFGNWVEVLPRGMQNEPHTGRIREIIWDDALHEIVYQIESVGVPIPNHYRTEELKPIEPPMPSAPRRVELSDVDSMRDVDEITAGLPVDEHRRRKG